MKAISLMLAALMTIPLFAGASECAMTTSSPEVDTGLPGPAPRLYVDDDGSLCEPCAISIWVYQESNGIDGLQRHDEVRDDTCGGAAGPGDTIIF